MRKQTLLGFLVILSLFSVNAQAETKRGKLWRVSAAVLGAVTIADMHSSVGRIEANPMLQSGNGRFGARGVSLKALVVGGSLAGQWLLIRKNPNAASYAAGMNFAMSSITGAVVVRNHMIK